MEAEIIKNPEIFSWYHVYETPKIEEKLRILEKRFDVKADGTIHIPSA